MKKLLTIILTISMLASLCFENYTYASVKDKNPPRVISSYPKNNEIISKAGASITITFSEKIKAGKMFDKISLTNSSKKVIQIIKTIKADKLYIKPKAEMTSGLKYILVIPTNSVKDYSENSFADNYKLEFGVKYDLSQKISPISTSTPTPISTSSPTPTTKPTNTPTPKPTSTPKPTPYYKIDNETLGFERPYDYENDFKRFLLDINIYWFIKF